MRSFSFILAVFVGFICWALPAVLSDGAAPFGKAGGTEGAIFFTPVALFALPLAVLAFVRRHSLTGIWICALAPVLGIINFVFSMSLMVHAPGPGGVDGAAPPTFALAWCLLLLIVLATVIFGKRPMTPTGPARG